MNEDYSWISSEGECKTWVREDPNMDMIISQIYDSNLEEIITPSEHPCEKFIAPSGQCWPILLGLSLKYADQVNADIPELENWRNLFKEKGWNGEINRRGTMNPGSYGRFAMDYPHNNIPQFDAKKNDIFGIMRPHGSGGLYIPVLKNDRLIICSDEGKGNTLFEAGSLKFYPTIYINKEDAHHLFSAAVEFTVGSQGTYLPNEAANIIWEWEQLKSGKEMADILHTKRE